MNAMFRAANDHSRIITADHDHIIWPIRKPTKAHHCMAQSIETDTRMALNVNKIDAVHLNRLFVVIKYFVFVFVSITEG